MNNQLTLLVFLKDRANFTKRLVNYLSEIKYPFPIIFADGSLEDENEYFFNSLKNVNFSYEYIRCPKDETLLNYYQKGVVAIERVKTSYVMLADNDDFPIIDGQLKAIDFLDKNPEYIGCNGRVSGINVHPCAQHPYGEHVLYLPYYCNEMDVSVLVNQSTAIERIRSYLTNFYSIFYCIYRTENLRCTLKDVRDLNFSDLGILELFFSYMQLAQGKVHSIDFITYIRQKGSSQAAASQKDWFHRLFYTEWLADLREALHHVAQLIAHKEKVESQGIYDVLYEDFLVRHRERFMVTDSFFYKNLNLFFNMHYLKPLIIHKIFRFSVVIGEWVGFYSLLPFTSKINLKKIKKIISKRP